MLFAAIYVPDFPVEAMVRAEPELREQAVAVVEGTPPLGHVVAVNERAAQAGVEPGMTRLQAEGRLVDGRWSMADGRDKPATIGAPPPYRVQKRDAIRVGQPRGNGVSRARAPAPQRHTGRRPVPHTLVPHATAARYGRGRESGRWRRMRHCWTARADFRRGWKTRRRTRWCSTWRAWSGFSGRRPRSRAMWRGVVRRWGWKRTSRWHRMRTRRCWRRAGWRA